MGVTGTQAIVSLQHTISNKPPGLHDLRSRADYYKIDRYKILIDQYNVLNKITPLELLTNPQLVTF